MFLETNIDTHVQFRVKLKYIFSFYSLMVYEHDEIYKLLSRMTFSVNLVGIWWLT